MESKVRTATIMLAVCAVLEGAAVIAQRAGSTHPPVLVTAFTGIAAALTAAGALGLNRGDSWAWPVAVGGALVSAVLAVGTIINAPVGAKIGGGLVVILAVVSLVVLLPLRRAGRAPHA